MSLIIRSVNHVSFNKILLRDKIKSSKKLVSLCQLQMHASGAGKLGYQLVRKGPFISCQLSDNLLNCATCFGSARRVGADGELKNCVSPSRF